MKRPLILAIAILFSAMPGLELAVNSHETILGTPAVKTVWSELVHGGAVAVKTDQASSVDGNKIILVDDDDHWGAHGDHDRQWNSGHGYGQYPHHDHWRHRRWQYHHWGHRHWWHRYCYWAYNPYGFPHQYCYYR